MCILGRRPNWVIKLAYHQNRIVARDKPVLQVRQGGVKVKSRRITFPSFHYRFHLFGHFQKELVRADAMAQLVFHALLVGACPHNLGGRELAKRA